MGVKAILDSVDDLPEDVRGFYTQDGDRYVLDVDDIDAHPKVRGVITANNTNKQTRDKLRAETAKLGGNAVHVLQTYNTARYAIPGIEQKIKFSGNAYFCE